MSGRSRQSHNGDAAQGQPRRKRHFLAYKRRWAIWGGVFVLLGGITTYNILTSDERIRALIERQLNDLSGAPVQVGSAEFSLVGGLTVRDVKVFASEGTQEADSLVLQAGHLNIAPNYLRLLRLKLTLERIEARDVRILLCEDLQSHTFNVQRLIQHAQSRMEARAAAASSRGERPSTQPAIDESEIPLVVLSNAQLTYARRQGDAVTPGGTLRLNATVAPLPQRRFALNLNLRTPGGAKPTSVAAILNLRSGEITGRTGNLRLDHTQPTLLPVQIQRFFSELAFAGRFSIPKFTYRFGVGQEQESFDITLAFQDIQAQVRPSNWLSRNETQTLRILRQSIRTLDMLGIGGRLQPGELAGDNTDDASPLDLISYFNLRSRTVPLHLDQLSGLATFSNSQITFQDVLCSVQGKPLLINGVLDGYDAQAPVTLRIQTAPRTFLRIPPSRQFVTWLPEEVRKLYKQFLPDGRATLDVKLDRNASGGPFETTVTVDISDASFEFDDFPYPLYDASGRMVFRKDPKINAEVLNIQHLRGHGAFGGPNEHSFIEVNGIAGPFIGRWTGLDIRISGENISSEPALRRAFPPEVASAMRIFGPLDYGKLRAQANLPAGQRLKLTEQQILEWPRFNGDFVATVNRDPGPGHHTLVGVTLDLKKASGSLKDFPYPLENVSTILKVIDGKLTIENLRMKRGDASLEMNGTVSFDEPANPDLQVKALNVPINDDLLLALPPTERSWLTRAGLGGHVDIIGRIFLDSTTRDVDFSLDLGLRDASLLKSDTAPAFTQVNGSMLLKPAHLDIHNLDARRGQGVVSASGQIGWGDGPPELNLQLNAENLLLDKPLHDILPQAAQETWDEQKPEGTADIDLHYALGNPAAPGQAAPATAPTTAPTQSLKLALRPRQMSATPAAFPLRLDNLQGELLIDNQQFQIKDMRATHGDSTFAVNAAGSTGASGEIRLSGSAAGLRPDPELLGALPAALSDLVKTLALDGTLGVRLKELYIRPAKPDPQVRALLRQREQDQPTTASAPTTQPLDVDFDCTLSTPDSKFSIGGPVTKFDGSAQLAGQIRSSQLVGLDGTLTGNTFEFDGRPGSECFAKIHRPMYTQKFQIEDLRTRLLGGSISGAITLVTPDRAPSQYAVDLALQNGDLNILTGKTGAQAGNARVAASLNVEGVFDDPRQRRGRGEILVRGKEIYEAPLVLGLFRMVNFALPGGGVDEVRLNYVLRGDRVIFENVELLAPHLRIYGTGMLDLHTREVSFTLNTENPNALPIPFIDPLLRGARRELFQIKIGGTLTETNVKTTSFPSFTATLDRVLDSANRTNR